MQALILGMHRSGTSAVTHLLARTGFHAGSAAQLKPADEANLRGYWERWDAWALHEQVLAAAGASWWNVADLDLGALTAVDRQRFATHARDLVVGFDENRPWVLKDPRLCLLLPLWRPALSAPVFVLQYRDPLEVARSLQARDQFPLAVGIALWEVYNLEALRHSRGAPRLIVSYRDLVNDPPGVAAAVASRLAPFTSGALAVPTADELAEVVVKGLQHQRADPSELAEHLNQRQQFLLKALADGSALGWNEVPAPSTGGLDALRRFAAGERRRQELESRAAASAERVAGIAGELVWLRDRDAEQGRWIESLKAALAMREGEIGGLRAALEAVERELGRLRARLEEFDQRSEEGERLLGDLVSHAEECRRQATELDCLLAEVLHSTTWRPESKLAGLRRRKRGDASSEKRREALSSAVDDLAIANAALAERVARWQAGRAGPLPEP